MKKQIRVAVSHAKAKTLGIPHTSSAGVITSFDIDLDELTPAARFVAEHITATYVKDEYTDKIPVVAVAGFTMAERDRAKGKSDEDIAYYSRAYGASYDTDRMTMRIAFPFYGSHMKRPEDVIEEAVRQCISAGIVEFRSGSETFLVG